jgi:5'-nucleotidase
MSGSVSYRNAAFMEKRRYQILLTNDDGIQSPGLWAAAEALSRLGYVTVAAPREQATSMGRAMPPASDGKLTPVQMRIGEQDWTVYAVGGTPAQAVFHAVEELLPDLPDLIVSGINYGENVGSGITISGTVMAALEGAAAGIPALAVSAQLLEATWFDYSNLDFSGAAYFTEFFARKLLESRQAGIPLAGEQDVALLKVDVPYGATPATPWRITRQSLHRYYRASVDPRRSFDENASVRVRVDVKPGETPEDTDVHTLLFDHAVSVTPISLDMTARLDLLQYEKKLREL